LAACVYMTLMGKKGMFEVAEINMDRADYLRQQIAKTKGFSADTEAPIFNEFVIKSDKPFNELAEKLRKNKIFAGLDLTQFYPELENEFLVCATETKSKENLDLFVKELSQC